MGISRWRSCRSGGQACLRIISKGQGVGGIAQNSGSHPEVSQMMEEPGLYFTKLVTHHQAC